MKVKYLLVLFLTVLFFGCDDSTDNIGMNIMPEGDKPPVGFQTFDVITNSLLADSVYARTSTGYLGKYTDPNFGIFEADFMAQFNCLKNYNLAFPRKQIVGLEEIGKARNVSVNLYLFYQKGGYFGDSLSPCRLSVYELEEILTESKESYYTNINPADYIGSNPILLGQKAYTAVDLSVNDSTRKDKNYIPRVAVKFTSNELGNNIIKWTKEHPEYFANSDEFIKNVFKGIYVKCDHGDGTILYIDKISLEIRADCYVDSAGVYPIKRKQAGHIGEDSIAQGSVAVFTATKEVIQANHFQNKGKIKELINDDNCTYIKSPAGIFTEASLPIDSISKRLSMDTLNSVKLTFTNYNNSNTSKYKMGIPNNLLMVRKKDMYTFFEKDKLSDGITSYLVTHNNTSNEYSFTNIARLVTTCLNEKIEGEKKDPEWTKKNKDWDKIVLIPVSIDKDANKNIISIRNNLELNSVRLKGGTKKGNQLKLEILYTKIIK